MALIVYLVYLSLFTSVTLSQQQVGRQFFNRDGSYNPPSQSDIDYRTFTYNNRRYGQSAPKDDNQDYNSRNPYNPSPYNPSSYNPIPYNPNYNPLDGNNQGFPFVDPNNRYDQTGNPLPGILAGWRPDLQGRQRPDSPRQETELDVLVTTTFGKVQGFRVYLYDNPIPEFGFRPGQSPVERIQANVSVFLGIPYALPPTNEGRFRPPRASPGWQIIQAVDFGPACPQPSRYTGATKGIRDVHEDCLYLNIYTPTTVSGLAHPYPVMFYIHGGEFSRGASNLFPGHVMAAFYQVVVVTINYRLGPLVMEINTLVGQDGCPSPGLTRKNGSGTPPIPGGLTLSWHELSVWIKKKDMEKSNFIKSRYEDTKILRKVSGIAEPGTLLAIMGPSGAGKTTLLATISQRLKGDVKGKLLVNGKEIKKELMLRISGFVPQHDLCIDSITVMEHMQLMARLKMDRNTTSVIRTQRIWDLLRELGVYKCRHTRMNALSGGQSKRVALAVQMLNDPGILFCDEPTTGLDSFNASSVIEQLRQLAGRGKTVICTIHQPASGLFDMFHTIYLLIPGGKLGLTMSTHQVSNFFSSVSLVCPPSYNIAEFVVSQLAVTEDLESRVRVGRIVRSFKDSKHYSDLVKRLDIQLSVSTPTVPSNGISSSLDSITQEEEFRKYLDIKTPSTLTQFYWLLWRSAVDIIRKPKVQIIRFLFYLFIAFLISSPYAHIKTDQEGIQNLQGFLYLVVVETIFTFNYSVFHIFPSELPILLREIGNGLYSPGAYYFSKMIILLPRTVVEPVIYSAVVFSITGLYGGIYGFVQFCVPVVACSMVATAYGCLISTVFESVATGSLVSVPFENVTLTFCGLFLSLSDVPFHFAWVKYVSVFYYALEAISILQWTQIDTIACDPRPEVPCITSGKDVLKVYGYSPNNFAMDMIGMASLYCTFHIIGFFAFYKRSQKQAAY